MNTRSLLTKLKSTKLWACIAGVAMGIAMALGADADSLEIIAGSITSLASLVTYIITEGKIDAKAIDKSVTSIQEAVEAINETNEEKMDKDGETASIS